MMAANISIIGVSCQYSLRTVEVFTVLTARITNVNIAIVCANSDLSRYRGFIESEESILSAPNKEASSRKIEGQLTKLLISVFLLLIFSHPTASTGDTST